MKLVFRFRRFLRSVISIGEICLWQYVLRTRKKTPSERIVIIQDCHIGDFLVSFTFFQRLKEFYGQPLTLISEGRIKPLAMASGLFEDVITVDMKKASSYRFLFYRIKTFWRFRKFNAKVLIQKYAAGGTSLEDILAVIIPADKKIGLYSEIITLNGGCKFYGNLWKMNFDYLYNYDTDKDLLTNENLFGNMLCGSSCNDPVGNLECFEPLPERDCELGEYILFIPGADDPRRRWETEKFINIAKKMLIANHSLKILISFAPGEENVVTSIYDALTGEFHDRVIVRKPHKDYLSSVKRLMSDCKYACMVITNDTAPMHISAKYAVKCYCLTGGWHWNYFSPCCEYKSVVFLHKNMPCYGCFGVCSVHRAPFKCLSSLSADDVWQNISSDFYNLASEI